MTRLPTFILTLALPALAHGQPCDFDQSTVTMECLRHTASDAYNRGLAKACGDVDGWLVPEDGVVTCKRADSGAWRRGAGTHAGMTALGAQGVIAGGGIMTLGGQGMIVPQTGAMIELHYPPVAGAGGHAPEAAQIYTRDPDMLRALLDGAASLRPADPGATDPGAALNGP